MGLVKAWSFSALKLYEECPARYKYEKLDKLPVPENPNMARGLKIHKKAEDYLLGDDPDAIPPELEEFDGRFQELHALRPMVEQEWAFTDKWKPTGWFAPDTWLRVKTDAAVLHDTHDFLDIIDHKTGKKYGENVDQVELFALAGFCMFPGVKEIDTHLWYLDSGDEQTDEFVRDKEAIAETKKEWEDRAAPMFNDEDFLPRPTSKCRWCPFQRQKGGPCKY